MVIAERSPSPYLKLLAFFMVFSPLALLGRGSNNSSLVGTSQPGKVSLSHNQFLIINLEPEYELISLSSLSQNPLIFKDLVF